MSVPVSDIAISGSTVTCMDVRFLNQGTTVRMRVRVGGAIHSEDASLPFFRCSDGYGSLLFAFPTTDGKSPREGQIISIVGTVRTPESGVGNGKVVSVQTWDLLF